MDDNEFIAGAEQVFVEILLAWQSVKSNPNVERLYDDTNVAAVSVETTRFVFIPPDTLMPFIDDTYTLEIVALGSVITTLDVKIILLVGPALFVIIDDTYGIDRV